MNRTRTAVLVLVVLGVAVATRPLRWFPATLSVRTRPPPTPTGCQSQDVVFPEPHQGEVGGSDRRDAVMGVGSGV